MLRRLALTAVASLAALSAAAPAATAAAPSSHCLRSPCSRGTGPRRATRRPDSP